MAIKVLIAQDHGLLRKALVFILNLEDGIEVIAEANDGAEAVELVKEHRPDVVLIDTILPRMDGLEATRHIKEQSRDTAVIILTVQANRRLIREAIRAGASGYLPKDVELRELAEAIRVVARGDSVIHPVIASHLLREFGGDDGPEIEQDILAGLTSRELEVLRLLSEGRSNREISRTLFISERTAKFHVSNILHKLHTASRTQAAILYHNSLGSAS